MYTVHYTKLFKTLVPCNKKCFLVHVHVSLSILLNAFAKFLGWLNLGYNYHALHFSPPINFKSEKKITLASEKYSLFSRVLQPLNWTKHMSRHMGKPTMCIAENKGADQLRSNCEADQHLCFRYMDSTLPPLLKSEISSF